eukprot:CAMPEP_0113954804 /NCGR_PEP_ID=MMETSP0011_2-20120614/846_1 /TAXON_ID=101924 /ORGANISM="Rhodosorus marinus" /LENGTH=69 /DNA_ID=CAMNT_0000964153 /DNA_START=906 /DNA_END=1116 /DNA_ORIENTATION=- /assembly_acc=CAM_ASM_000156
MSHELVLAGSGIQDTVDPCAGTTTTDATPSGMGTHDANGNDLEIDSNDITWLRLMTVAGLCAQVSPCLG